jgi:hypothetical protein
MFDAITNAPTPVFNTPDPKRYFGGNDGNTLLLDNQKLMRCVETVLFPNTRVTVIECVDQSTLWKIKTPAYPYEGEFYIDSRFINLTDTTLGTRKAEIPSIPQLRSRLDNLVNSRYIWGGSWPEGVPQLAKLFPSRSPFDQLDQDTQELWTLKGVDCSGLLNFVTNGATPRNTSKLVDFGRPIEVEGLQPEQIAEKLEDTDLIVWSGHVITVFSDSETIESINPQGVVKRSTVERLSDIMRERIPVNTWNATDKPHFVVRRWHPDNL